MVRQRIAEVNQGFLKFNDGDRLLIKLSVDLKDDELRKLSRSVMKFAKADVRLYFINCMTSSLFVVDYLGRTCSLANASSLKTAGAVSRPLGIASIDCSVVPMSGVAKLVLIEQSIKSDTHQNILIAELKRWAGVDIEVQVGVASFG